MVSQSGLESRSNIHLTNAQTPAQVDRSTDTVTNVPMHIRGQHCPFSVSPGMATGTGLVSVPAGVQGQLQDAGCSS